MKVRTSPRIAMRDHPDFSERWLQEHIEADPSVLGLGDLQVIERERQMPSGGRLDLLLIDNDSGVRYEVELQTGATDGDHIIRTLEYWDLERRRYPHAEHVAVIVAEEVTGRFFNVIGLFNRHIPIIAVQMEAYDLGDDEVLLTFATVLDHVAAMPDDTEVAVPVWNRSYWDERSTPEVIEVMDGMFELLRNIDGSVAPKYNKYYVGVRTGRHVTNFVSFKPQQQKLRVNIRLPEDAVDDAAVAAAGLERLAYDARSSQYRIGVGPGYSDEAETLLADLFADARERYASHWGMSWGSPSE